MPHKRRKVPKPKGDAKKHRRYKVPLKVPEGRSVGKNWALLSSMLESTAYQPIGDADFWNTPVSRHLRHVQLSKDNRIKFADVIKNGKTGKCPIGCRKSATKVKMMHPQRYVYLWRLSQKMDRSNREMRKEMEEDGFKLSDPSKKKKITEVPVLRDPRTGDVMSDADRDLIVKFAKSQPGTTTAPDFVRNYPGKRLRPPIPEKDRVYTSKSTPDTFIGTRNSELRKRRSTKRRVARLLEKRLANSRLSIKPGEHTIAKNGNIFLVPITIAEHHKKQRATTAANRRGDKTPKKTRGNHNLQATWVVRDPQLGSGSTNPETSNILKPDRIGPPRKAKKAVASPATSSTSTQHQDVPRKTRQTPLAPGSPTSAVKKKLR